MKTRPENGGTSSPLTLMDQVSERFDAACKKTPRDHPLPSLEDFLGQTPESARAEVLRQLLKVEWEYRQVRGELPAKTEYLARFPGNEDVVEAAWREISTRSVSEKIAPAAHGSEAFTPEDLSAKLPQFEVLELIGKGGMGAVYKARQRGPDRQVALKVIAPGLSHGAEFTRRFGREAKALGSLDHPNIAAIHDSGELGGLYYLVMEYAGGGDLRQFVEHRIQAGEVLAIVVQICDALQFAHDKGIVHRDIKPGNILLVDRGRKRIKIGDFGLAKLRGKNLIDDTLTGTDQVMGSMGYMAPEQMGGARDVDGRADIYSLGVVFYELLTGKRPAGTFPPPSKVVQIDRRLDEIVFRALAMDPEKRYQKASELKTAVEAIQQSPDKFTFLTSRLRSRNPFSTIKTAGLLLPVDLLARIAEMDPRLPGLTPETYHLEQGEKLNEAASRAWNVCLSAWKSYRQAAAKLPASDKGTTLTRDRWLLPLFKELGYGRLQAQKAIQIEDKTYPISHGWEHHVPIHLVSFRYDLDRRTPGAAGAASRSPYSLTQELLNRSAQHRWGFLSNGNKLYILRDNASLARSANVEFDLEAMFDSEVYADFQLLFLVCHQSRVEIPADGKPEDCWLEKWSKLADDQGTRAREKLRDGVENAIKALGAGFLTTKGNNALKDRLSTGALSTQDYYRQLLRTVYRLLLLLVAEEKKTEDGQNLLHPPETPNAARERYARFYSVGRLRTLAAKRRGTSHTDLFESLKLLYLKLRTGYAPLGIPGLGSFLFSDNSTPDLDTANLSNEGLLSAIRELCETEDTTGRGAAVRRPVDFANLGSDELGSVYESLLELHPKIDTDEGPFTLATAPGHERKTTSSYYTRAPLINCLLDCALDPVVAEALDSSEPENALLSLKVCDPACGSGHFLIAAADRLAKHLASLRTGDDEPTALAVQHAKRDIIGRCVYGVDMNPMAVELCQVALWMEALEPGKPLTFLKHHIQCGNSLIGATPAVLAKGIPDDAFKTLEGDDNEYCLEWKAKNKDDRRGQGRLLWDQTAPWEQLGDIAAAIASLDTLPDDTPDQVRAKQQKYEELVNQANYRTSGQFLADVFCAAFFWKKTKTFDYPITENVFRKAKRNPHDITPWMFDEIARLREEFKFFHWHLAFPGVFRPPTKGEKPDNEITGWCGGFDVVLGNPPWDAMSPDAKEFFSAFDPQVRFQDTSGQRRIIDQLLQEPRVAAAWNAYCRALYTQVHFIKRSGRYRLFAPGNLGKGDFNVFRMFVETALQTVCPGGRPAQIVPDGLYNGANSMAIRQALFDECELHQIFGFENANEVWFADIDTRMKFCIYSATSGGTTTDFRTAFNIRSPAQLAEVQSGTALVMPVSLVRTFSPDALAVMELSKQTDIDIAGKMYKWPAFGDESAGDPNRHLIAEIHMGNDRELFNENADGVPVYEGRMVDQFDYRAKGYRAGRGRAAEWDDFLFDNAAKAICPQWFIRHKLVPEKVREGMSRYRIGFCAVGSPTNERTLISCVIPPNVVCGHSVLTIIFEPAGYDWYLALWVAIANSYAMDFVTRMKVALNITKTIVDSLPFPRPSRDDPRVRPLIERSLRLLCTGPEMIPFWNQLATEGWVRATQLPTEIPGELNEDVRLKIRAEIDAMVARDFFSLSRPELEYILETFPTQRRYQVEKYSEFRSRRLILEAYDALPDLART